MNNSNKVCKNDETIITLEPFKETDTKIFVPILKADKSHITDDNGNTLHNCYTADELYEMAEMAYRNDKHPSDPLTNQPLSIEILRQIFSAKGLDFDKLKLKDTIKHLEDMIESISYNDRSPEIQDKVIQFLKMSPFLVTEVSYGYMNSTVLQLVCAKYLYKVAQYILENFTPEECKLDNTNHYGKTALLLALQDSSMRTIVGLILEKDPLESNILHILKYDYSSLTALILTCKDNYEKESLMILEQLNRLYEEDKVEDEVLLNYLTVESVEYIKDESYDDEYLGQAEVYTKYVDALYYAQKNSMTDVVRKITRLIELLRTEAHEHQGGVALKYRRKKSIKRRSSRKKKRVSKKSSKRGSRKRSYRRR
jgi:hypothetical protein